MEKSKTCYEYIIAYMEKVVKHWAEGASCSSDDKVAQVLDTLGYQLAELINNFENKTYTKTPYENLKYI